MAQCQQRVSVNVFKFRIMVMIFFKLENLQSNDVILHDIGICMELVLVLVTKIAFRNENSFNLVKIQLFLITILILLKVLESGRGFGSNSDTRNRF